MFQLGYSEDRDFHSTSQSMPEPSAWNTFPSEEFPLTKFKHTSMELNFSPDLLSVSRQTYSILDWLGDMGGLMDAL